MRPRNALRSDEAFWGKTGVDSNFGPCPTLLPTDNKFYLLCEPEVYRYIARDPFVFCRFLTRQGTYRYYLGFDNYVNSFFDYVEDSQTRYWLVSLGV
jgi:hypothetical protein